MREFHDSIERHKNKILVMKNENRQKAKEQRNLLKELKATEKENNEKIARSSQEVNESLIHSNKLIFTSESTF